MMLFYTTIKCKGALFAPAHCWRLSPTMCVSCYQTVSISRMEQRINTKFLVKLRKTPTECFKLLKEVYGEDVMLGMQIFKWHKRFEKGHKWRMIPRQDNLPQQGQMKT